MIPAFYFLGLAFLMTIVNHQTLRSGFAKWATYQLIWIFVLLSLITIFYYFYTGQELRL